MTNKVPVKKDSTGAEMSPIASDEVFQAIAALEGFDIRGFDKWLTEMEPCGAKIELSERRQWAREAVRYGAINNDALLRHLEWMLLRWKYIRRLDYLTPLARTGKAVADGRKKPRRPDIDEWIERQLERDPGAKSPALWNKAPEWLTDKIGERRFSTRVTKARKARK